MQYEVGEVSYRVSAGAFFQTNRFLVSRVVELVNDSRQGRIALDLYSGVGLFAVPLARRFERVIAVESSPISASDLRVNVPANVKVSTQTVEGYLTSVAGTLKPNVIVADPPRFGLGQKVCAHLSRLKPQEIVYVSCDPATLARDIGHLVSDGWRIAEIHLLDLFPQTFHIEACAVLRRG
jgi:23S rRNA (uracil1939-C5)-methyltransferase